MPKRRIHPSLLPNGQVDEAAAYGGHPNHGDPFPGHDEDFEDEIDEDEDEEEPQPHADPYAQRFADYDRRLGALQNENEQLRRMIPPAQQRQPQPAAEDEEPNWEELLFKDPKAALKLHGDRVAKAVKAELTQQYQTEQSNSRFWNEFYKEHDDLYEDHDLVLATMNKHFNEIANLPSKQAQKVLADLTRARIMKYSGKGSDDGTPSTKKKSRAHTEGAEPPSRKKAQPQPSNVHSISSLIKARREKRFKRGRVA